MTKGLFALLVAVFVIAGHGVCLSQRPPASDLDKMEERVKEALKEAFAKINAHAKKQKIKKEFISHMDYSRMKFGGLAITPGAKVEEIPPKRKLYVKGSKLLMEVLREKKDKKGEYEKIAQMYYSSKKVIELYLQSKTAKKIKLDREGKLNYYHILLRQPYRYSHLAKYFDLELLGVATVVADKYIPEEYKDVLEQMTGGLPKPKKKKYWKEKDGVIEFKVPTTTWCHCISLKPKNKKIAKKYMFIRIYIDYKNFFIVKIELQSEQAAERYTLKKINFKEKIDPKMLKPNLKGYKIVKGKK